MKILVDECLTPRWGEQLRRAGLEATHWREVGATGAPDSTLYRWAAENDHIILTADLDFSQMLFERNDNVPSVIQIRVTFPYLDELEPTILQLLKKHHDALEKGALVTLTDNGDRIRVLPVN